jgi:DNA repair exonuclease SbcCD nuclease subunit
VKIIHAADLHVDSPLRGLQRYPNAPVDRIRGATREALVNLVHLCIDEEASALLLAGDVFDGDWKDYSTGLFFVGQMARLKEAGVRVFSVRGNHDHESKMGKKLSLPDNVTELSTRKPQTVIDEDLGLAVHGQGFAKRVVDEDLAASYPEPVSGLLNVGILHTSLDGRPGHHPYAPTSAEVLASKGYDYWALGHVHAREVVRKDPWIVFPGNTQGRHARETGEKGATVITIEGGRIESVEARVLDVVRWIHLEIDASELDHPTDVVEAARELLENAVEEAEPRLVAARVSIVGESAAHGALLADAERWEQELRGMATDVGESWIEKVRFKTRERVDLEELIARDDAVGALFARLAETSEDPDALAECARVLDDLKTKLPREAKLGDDGVDLDDPRYLADALADATQLLLPRLFARGEE